MSRATRRNPRASTKDLRSAGFSGGVIGGFVGDSITAGSGSLGAGFTDQAQLLANGAYVTQLRGTLGGFPSMESGYILSQLPGLITANPLMSWVHVLAGTNDAGNATALATTQANIKAIVAMIRAAGMTPILGTLPPRTSGTTVTMATQAINRWLRMYCALNGVMLVDYYKALVDPTTGFYAAGMSYDSTHPSAAGHLAMAQALNAALIPRLPAQALPGAHSIEVGTPQNLIAKPLMLTSTSNVPDSFIVDAAKTGETRTMTTVSGVPGNVYQVTLTNSNATASLPRQTITTGFSAGDILMISAYLETTTTSAVATDGLYWFISFAGPATQVSLLSLVRQPVAGRMYALVTVPAGTTGFTLSGSVTAGSSSTITARYGAVSLINLTAQSMLI